jgi:SAM-dependent methyltransferase
MITELTGAEGVNQRFVNLHCEPAEYEERLKNADCVFASVLADYAPGLIQADDTILDIGCGTGVVARTLKQTVNHRGRRFASDISPVMIEHVMNEDLYDRAYLGPAFLAAHMLLDCGDVDWAIALSSLYYMDPDELEDLLNSLYVLCDKGMILTLDGVTPEFWDSPKIVEKAGGSITLYDHRGYFHENPPPDVIGWKAETIYEGIGWTSVSTGLAIECEVVCLLRSDR